MIGATQGAGCFGSGAVVTGDGEKIPFAFSMIVPPFAGQDFLRATEGLTNTGGFIEVRDTPATGVAKRFPAERQNDW